MPPAKNPNITKPKQEGDARRKGKKNVEWQDDAEIMQRLGKVAVLMNEHRRAHEIAQETKVSIETARRDIARVRELWRADARDQIKDAKDFAIAQYREVIQQARVDLKKVSVKSGNRAAFHKIIIQAQERIDKVTGIADKVEHSGPDGGPIPVGVVDMEAVRKKRWKQVARILVPPGEQENNATQSPKPAKKSD